MTARESHAWRVERSAPPRPPGAPAARRATLLLDARPVPHAPAVVLAFRAVGYTDGASALDGSAPPASRALFPCAPAPQLLLPSTSASPPAGRTAASQEPRQEYFATSRSSFIPAPGTADSRRLPFVLFEQPDPSRFATARRFFRRRWRWPGTSAPDAPSCVGWRAQPPLDAVAARQVQAPCCIPRAVGDF